MVASFGSALISINYADNIKESSPLFLLKPTIQNDSINTKFDTRGMPELLSIKDFSSKYGLSPNKLEIAGVGMRRKNFYVMEVDVYLASLHLTKSILNTLKNTRNSDNIDLVDMILNANNQNVGSKYDARASISL